ncbi:hypothetical protein [Kingella negevensis]|uniref:hypothetical protein n=1 Tax=Kingella negevensis TaxID=1522312 RepID=UPI002551BF45|nr:hypothetical protein [Kingella negevensis]MDK4680703.1 hypothetical protein [Kingella negevensis]MDK4681573.1 hypothetical protein [Kingella negevensis]MDK4691961.1 hypothetical protein [Kingella negevensis]MDK4692885.1 hypothetical protein [Kingella negevensis]MDK4699185.1 hypothetical protein [Kingella negevensis]
MGQTQHEKTSQYDQQVLLLALAQGNLTVPITMPQHNQKFLKWVYQLIHADTETQRIQIITQIKTEISQ